MARLADMTSSKFIMCIVLTVLPLFETRAEQTIVPMNFLQDCEFKYAVKFLNKYADLLNTIQSEAVADTLLRTKNDGMRYNIGNDARLKSLSGNEDFSITLIDRKYTATWSEGSKTLVSCSFPTNVGLLTFSSKTDLESYMSGRLSVASQSSEEQIPLPSRLKSELQRIEYSDFFISDRGYFVTPKLDNHTVYVIVSNDSTRCVLLNDPAKYPIETLNNVLLSGYSTQELQMNVKLSRYGYQSETFVLPFTSLYRLLSEEGSIPYWGIDTFDGKDVTGVYVWVNNYGGFAHVMSVRIPISAVTDSAIADVRFHCYVRLDNLKSLFEEYPQL